MPLKVGDTAPDFEVPAVVVEEKQKFKLSDLRGKKNVVIAFYPLDWTSTCTIHVPTYQQALEKLRGLNAEVLAISTDSIPSHIAWQQKSIGKLEFPHGSDFFPHGAVAEKFGVMRNGDPIPGINERAVFVVDKQGKIAFAQVYELNQEPDVEDVIAVLNKLN